MRLLVGAAISCGALGTHAVAQTEPAPPTTPGESEQITPPKPNAAEIKPAVFYVRDSEGNLVPLPGKWTYEEFRKLYDLQQNVEQPNAGPRFTLQSLSAKAIALNDRVQVDVEMQITQTAKGWIRVPLRMPRAVFAEAPQHQGPGKLLVAYTGAETGYVAWIEGEADKSHRLTLKILLPRELVGDEYLWQWNVPPSTKSELTITVPRREALVEATPGGTIVSTKNEAKSTVVKLLGINGNTRFSWRPPIQRIARSTRTLEASGACLIRLERGYVRSEMTLTMRSFGAEYQRFTVRMPPGARLISETIDGGTIARLEGNVEQDAKQGGLYEVKLTQPRTTPYEFRLVTERAYKVTADGDEIELAGFEVPEAVRQFGHVAVQLVGDWQVLWGDAINARRVETLPSALPGMDVLAGFEYFSQPFSLPAKVIAPPTRIAVESEYAIYVTPGKMRLDSRIQYRVSGAKVYELAFDLADWDADSIRVDPANLVDLDALVVESGEPLQIPLKQPLRGDFEIRLKATRTLPPDTDQVTLSLLTPQATSTTSALVAIVPADNLALRPVADKSVDFVGTQLAPQIEWPDTQQQPLLFRADRPTARLVTDMTVFDQQLAIEASVDVQMSTTLSKVTQRWDYNIQYVPLTAVTFNLPSELRSNAKLQLFVDEAPIDLSALVATGPGTGDEPGFRDAVTIPLKKPRLGKLAVRLEAEFPADRLQADTALQVALPLANTLTGTVAETKLSLASSDDMLAELADQRWTSLDELRSTNGTNIFGATGETNGLTLMARRQPTKQQPGMLVSRAWVRTWFTPDARHDRVAYRFRTELAELVIGLPEEVAPESVQVLLDGETVPSVSDDSGSLSVTLGKSRQASRTLELRYYIAGQSPRWSREVMLPTLPPGSWIDQQYWQVVLPRNQHLLAASESCNPIYRWGWQRLGFGRQPLLRQDELADWVGVELGTPVPDQANQYVFAQFAEAEPARIAAMSRSLVVLTAAGSALLIGLLLTWLPRLRHPVVLLCGLIALVAVGALYPELAFVLLQTAVLGVVLLLLGLFIRGYFHRTPPSSLSHVATGSSSKHATTDYFHGSGTAATYGSSARTSIAVPQSVTESNV